MEIEVTEYVYDEDNETITEETICSYKKINNKKVLVRSENYTYTDDYYIEHDVEYYTGTSISISSSYFFTIVGLPNSLNSVYSSVCS